jgi:hypothetical protein
MTETTPSLILHIGQHKTGSKALQSFLARHRQALRDHQILYPIEEKPSHGIQAYANSQYRLFALVRRESIAARAGETAAARYGEQQRDACRPYESAGSLFEDLEAERVALGLSRMVLSAEDCFEMQTAHEIEFSLELVEEGAHRLARLASEFGHEPQIVVYLRRQDHLLGSHYGQYIKGSPVHDLDFEEFAQAFALRLDSWCILSRWAAVFGPDRIRVRPYERGSMPGGIVPDFFKHVLGFRVPDDWIEPPADVESLNRGLGRDFIEYIRILNSRNRRGQVIFAREDVLEAALRSGDPAGIADWLSPRARRDLLASYSEGNAAIASEFLGRQDGRLFAEPPPHDDEGWNPYAGLTPEKATAISLAVHEIAVGRTSI